MTNVIRWGMVGCGDADAMVTATEGVCLSILTAAGTPAHGAPVPPLLEAPGAETLLLDYERPSRIAIAARGPAERHR